MRVRLSAIAVLAVAIITIAMPGFAMADDADKSGYTLFDPVPDDLMKRLRKLIDNPDYQELVKDYKVDLWQVTEDLIALVLKDVEEQIEDEDDDDMTDIL